METKLCSEKGHSDPLSIIPVRHKSQDSPTFFVTINGDIYVNDDKTIYRTTKSITSPETIVRNVSSRCIDLFIDFTNTLYCSMKHENKVVKFLLEYEPKEEILVAGNETGEATSYSLQYPHGIFVDIELNLYVADSGNNRIQLFRYGSTNGTTVAGNRALKEFGLNYPTGIVLDADGYLFIIDRNNRRIIRSEINGFICIIGCPEPNGLYFYSSFFNNIYYSFSYDSHAHHGLHGPHVLWFDSYGNLFVLDHEHEPINNCRVQKFSLSTNSCGMFKSVEFHYNFFLISKKRQKSESYLMSRQ